MGQGNSAETDATLKAMVSKLSKLEIKDIEAVFMELSSKTDEGQYVIHQPSWLNRDRFAEIFGLTDLMVEQLFQAFDRDKNGIIDLQEFVTGMALCLHGGIKEKCHLLFKIFNLDEDDGVSREELSTVLISCLTSANTLLQSTLKSKGMEDYAKEVEDQTGAAVMVNVLVDKIVKDAFDTCDVSKTGKLEIEEFARWVHKNPKLMNNIFVLQCPKPSNSQSKASLSGESEYLTIGSVNEKEDVFEPSQQNIELARSVSETSTMSSKSTLLQMSKETIPTTKTTTTASDLFKDSVATAEGADFFDTLGSNQQSDNNQLTRPASELFLSTSSTTDNAPLTHSTSHNDLDAIQQYENAKRKSLMMGPHMQMQSTESMQSITLSQDSLLDKSSTNDLTSSHENMNDEGLSLQGNNDQQTTYHSDSSSTEQKEWHPLQGGSGLEEPANDINTNEDHSQSFDNPALSLASEAPLQSNDDGTQIFPEQPAPIQTNFLASMDEPGPDEHKRRRGSFWEPSRQTTRLLNNQNTTPVESSMLTSPSVLVEHLQGKVKDLVRKHLGEQEANKLPTLSHEHVEMNENGLKKLLAAGCWRAAIDFTTKYLTANGQGLVTVGQTTRTGLNPSILQIWLVRIALLVKLRMFSSAEAELNAFHDFDAPDLYYQFYPDIYEEKPGSIVPFSLRLLHAELPQHNGRPNVSLDRLYTLLEKVEKIVENLGNGLTEDGNEIEDQSKHDQELLDVWRSRKIRLYYAIGNCFLTMKDYILAIQLYQDCAKLQPERKWAITSAIGRIFLQLGDLKSAQKYFTQVEECKVKEENLKTKISNLVIMNSGFMALSKGQYGEAYQHFSNSMKTDPENFAAHNNAAVCLVSLGKVKEASNILENMVWRSPDDSLHEDILFNLNTVYELETSRALQKKYKLLDLVSQHKGDGFNTQCLKLS